MMLCSWILTFLHRDRAGLMRRRVSPTCVFPLQERHNIHPSLYKTTGGRGRKRREQVELGEGYIRR
jgi:hypothetical protein